MTPKDRVCAAYHFKAPDRIPRFDGFWDYPDDWQKRFGDQSELSDIEIWVPSEGAFPTRERILSENGNDTVRISSWGSTTRSRKDSFFSETLEVAIPKGTDPDTVEFDRPDLDDRFGEKRDATIDTHYVFGKTGGPYLRTTYVRGETQFLVDIAADPNLAKVLSDKMADHLAAVGVEEIRRWKLYETGISIWDDMAFNQAPMFSPAQFEKIFLPGYRRMIKAFRDTGAPHVFLHSDGNVMPILEMLVDAGIDGLNPLERRAGMNPFSIRKRFPELVLIGGMDNTDTLTNGPVEKIEDEARELIDLGREGGLIIGTHSVSPEISLEYFSAYDKICRTYGNFTS